MKDAVRQTPSVGGSIPIRRALVLVIKLATNHDLHQEAKQVFHLFDTWVRHEGKRSAVLRLKAIYQIVLNRSLGQVPFQPPFIATVRGFPRAVVYLEKYCTSPEGIQAVLTLLGYWRGVRAPGIPDLSPIMDPMSVQYPVDLENEVMKEVPPKWCFRPNSLAPVRHYFSTKFGPNGKLFSCLQDLKALERDPKLIGALTNLLELTDSEEYSEYLEELRDVVELDDTPAMVHSRLSVKQELGGKDRVFAIVDYFTQCTLRPLHDHVSKILRDIREDVTWDQGAASETLKDWTKGDEPSFSFDLSNATDRLPARLQRAVLQKLTSNGQFADSWLYLMSQRDFTFRRKTGIRYSVGQPMGAYSSWPVFALTHHLLVRVAARRVGIRHPQYFLLGDDICLRSEVLSKAYLHILSELGLKISQHKSVTGKVAEFAKRIYYRGGEISPIPVRLISSGLRDSRLIVTIRDRLISQSYLGPTAFDSVKSGLERDFVKLLPRNQQNQALVLLAVPSRGQEGLGPLLNQVGKAHLGTTDLELDWKYCSTFTRYNYLVQRYNEEQKRVTVWTGVPDFRAKPSNSTKLPGLDTGYQDLHPVSQAAKLQKEQALLAYRALGKYWTALTQQGLDAEMPKVNLPDLKDLTPSYQKRLKLEATVTLKSVEAFTRYLEMKETQPSLSFKGFLLLKTKERQAASK